MFMKALAEHIRQLTKWLIRRAGYYWPTMLEDCFKYYKGCTDCQKFGAVQMAPANPLHPMVKPWPLEVGGWI